jgi:hypothetical protein
MPSPASGGRCENPVERPKTIESLKEAEALHEIVLVRSHEGDKPFQGPHLGFVGKTPDRLFDISS